MLRYSRYDRSSDKVTSSQSLLRTSFFVTFYHNLPGFLTFHITKEPFSRRPTASFAPVTVRWCIGHKFQCEMVPTAWINKSVLLRDRQRPNLRGVANQTLVLSWEGSPWSWLRVPPSPVCGYPLVLSSGILWSCPGHPPPLADRQTENYAYYVYGQ